MDETVAHPEPVAVEVDGVGDEDNLMDEDDDALEAAVAAAEAAAAAQKEAEEAAEAAEEEEVERILREKEANDAAAAAAAAAAEEEEDAAIERALAAQAMAADGEGAGDPASEMVGADGAGTTAEKAGTAAADVPADTETGAAVANAVGLAGADNDEDEDDFDIDAIDAAVAAAEAVKETAVEPSSVDEVAMDVAPAAETSELPSAAVHAVIEPRVVSGRQMVVMAAAIRLSLATTATRTPATASALTSNLIPPLT